MRRIVIAVAALWAATAHAQPAHAQPARINVPLTPAYAACTNKAVSTADTRECAMAELAVWDKRLNAAYGKVMASRNWGDDTKGLVRTAQRNWLAYRQAKCAAEGQMVAEGGTLAGIIDADCFVTETALRALELEDALAPH